MYKFYLNAENFSGAASQKVSYKWIRAIYYPTSYGPVSVMVPTIESTASMDLSSEGSQIALDGPRQYGSLVEVDLRDMEIRALRIRAAAEEAERELQEAQRAKMEEKRSEKIE